MLVRHRTYTPTFDRTFDRSIDRAFDQLTNSFFETRRGANGPLVDGVWADDHYVLTVDLPGVPADAVCVDVTGSTLTLGAKTDTLEWERSLRLGGRLDPDKIHARHVDGRLTVKIGTVDEPEARSIAIDTSAPDLAIETTSTDVDQSTETNDSE
jgi:HSP20 family protein